MHFLTVREGEGHVLSELTLCEHPINNKHLALNDEFISRFIILLTDANDFYVARISWMGKLGYRKIKQPVLLF